MSPTQPDKVRSAFDRAAHTYEQAAILQREVTARLMERLEYIKLKPQTILDVGAGTGTGTRALGKRYPRAGVVSLDFSLSMLRELKARAPFWRRPMSVCADANRLPFKDHSFDLIFSSLTLQWCLRPESVFREMIRVLRPGGALLFSSLGPDTLHELRSSWAAVDSRPHVNEFADMHHIGDALLRAGFADPVVDVERITLTYPDVLRLLKDIKRIGANTVVAANGQAPGLTGKGRLAAMRQAYAMYKTAAGDYPATYEVVYGLAWSRDASVQPMTFVPLNRLR